jgi:ABC-type nitrate/sulfonate/bicarbonate transport system substrate-binding protein
MREARGGRPGPINKMEELRGKKVAVPGNSSAE